MKPYIAKFSELSGPMNPTGIINARYLNLVSALQRNDHPDNVKQALLDWLSQRNISQAEVESMLKLDPDEAVVALLQKIGGKLVGPDKEIGHLPKQVPVTVRRALQAIAGSMREREGQGIASKIASLRDIKRRYAETSAAEALADTLLA